MDGPSLWVLARRCLLRWAESPIASVWTWSTLAGHSAVPRGTNVTPMSTPIPRFEPQHNERRVYEDEFLRFLGKIWPPTNASGLNRAAITLASSSAATFARLHSSKAGTDSGFEHSRPPYRALSAPKTLPTYLEIWPKVCVTPPTEQLPGRTESFGGSQFRVCSPTSRCSPVPNFLQKSFPKKAIFFDILDPKSRNEGTFAETALNHKTALNCFLSTLV